MFSIVRTHEFSIHYTAFTVESSVTDRKPVGSDDACLDNTCMLYLFAKNSRMYN